jgi:hypothetical protein
MPDAVTGAGGWRIMSHLLTYSPVEHISSLGRTTSVLPSMAVDEQMPQVRGEVASAKSYKFIGRHT